jgi:hypothetical protein
MENEAAPEPTAVEEEVGAYVDQATAKATDLYETNWRSLACHCSLH